MAYYAHSGRSACLADDGEPLARHLQDVSTTAKRLAESAVPGDPALAAAARAAGLLHDLGKYRPGFQAHIRKPKGSRSGDESHHKQAGAAHAANHPAMSVAIAGHHGGLPDLHEMRSIISQGAGRPALADIWTAAVADCPNLAAPVPPMPPLTDPFAADLWTRVLFACLVDADWTCTGEFERTLKKLPPEPDAPPLEPAVRLERVRGFIDGKAKSCPQDHIRRVRADVLAACLAAAAGNPGVYSLTVPTGGGKTLASLAFALEHAAAHGLRRVIYVAPYLTILEQNVEVIRKALGVPDAAPDVFAHYSLAEPTGGAEANDTVRDAAARRAENWDAPVVVTTNVQFFESLFSNQPGRCRKVHNIARSVVVLDECQSLPPGLVAPTCGMLKQLTTQLGCTVVLCTATQPAFDHSSLKPDERLDAREIIPAELNLFDRLRRVTLTWPKPGDAALSWAEVAGRLAKERQALCVVNTKKAARAVYDELAADEKARAVLFHLSTAMCPQHRREKLAQIRGLLAAGAPCRVVSTQLIEAGVDVDFPFLMRELGPLEAVIQAAGRCNREGKLGADGRVVVFRSEEGGLPLCPWYRTATKLLDTDFLNDGYEPQIDRPDDIRRYYRKLYRSGQLDKSNIQAKRLEEKYATVAADYKLIRDDTVPVLVTTWAGHQAEIASLLVELDEQPRKEIRRRLAVFQVNVFRHKLRDLKPHIDDTRADDLLLWTSRYDESFGVVEELDAAWVL